MEKSFEESSSLLARIFCIHVEPVMTKCGSTLISNEDLGPTSYVDRIEVVTEKMSRFWKEEMKLPVEKRSLWRVIFNTMGWNYVFLTLTLFFSYSVLSFGPPMILNVLVQYFDSSMELSQLELYGCVVAMLILPTLSSISLANIFKYRMATQARNGLIGMIYQKSMRVSTTSRSETSTGHIINMFSNDTTQVMKFVVFIENLVFTPFIVVVTLYLINLQVGIAILAGIGLIIVLIPLNVLIFYILSELRIQKISTTDERVKCLNEIMNGIRVIKLQAWEGQFSKKVKIIRDEELVLLKTMARIVALGFSLFMTSIPVVLPILVFYVYIQMGNSLTAATAFTTISLLVLLTYPLQRALPAAIPQLSQTIVAVDRIRTYLLSEELERYVSHATSDDGTVISMSNASLSWVKEDSPDSMAVKEDDIDDNVDVSTPLMGSHYGSFDDLKNENDSFAERSSKTLRSLNFSVKEGELVAVVGACGAGKSSLLAALLGEMLLDSGLVRMTGSVAYCPQQPWILNDTIKGNILFGLPYDEERFYNAVLAASLDEDVQALEGGVNTQIGEKGINLSGGQKARVALARAVYRNADIYLLDDPLSAMDAHVRKLLFNECISGELSKKTRILVTHSVHLLPRCDKIIFLRHGEIAFFGTYLSFSESASQFERELAVISNNSSHDAEDDITRAMNDEEVAMKASTASREILLRSRSTSLDIKPKSVDTKGVLYVPQLAQSFDIDGPAKIEQQRMKKEALKSIESRSSTITQKESVPEEFVPFSVFWYYVKSGGVLLFGTACLFIIGDQVFTLLSSYLLSAWGAQSTAAEDAGTELTTGESLEYFDQYTMWCGLAFTCAILRSMFVAEHRVYASGHVHNEMLKSVLGAQMSFFDVTPVGRVLNRFSSDILTIDEDLPTTLEQSALAVGVATMAIVAIIAATKGSMLLFIIPLIAVFVSFINYFTVSNNQVTRLINVSRSPIYADFSQVLNGMSSVRAYRSEDLFTQQMQRNVDVNTCATMTQWSLYLWLTIRLGILTSIITFVIALTAVILSDFMSPGLLAIALSYSLKLSDILGTTVMRITTLKAQMNCVQRVEEYATEIDQEETEDDEVRYAETLVSKEWPARGQVNFTDVQLRYRDGPLVLKGVDFATESFEKVGIVGRTGSGKSSIMAALFRTQELHNGSITVDGVNLASISRQLLRSKLSIVAQEPVMFSGTVRFNLDPLELYSDNEVWNALQSVGMADYVRGLGNQLNQQVSEGGGSFSLGHRQLMCIARVLLRKPKILVLDEATASIDNETDALVQKVITEQFKQCTVLTIAHRLNTIINNDKIMLLDDGLVVENGTPNNLLANLNGIFKCLWDKHIQEIQQRK